MGKRFKGLAVAAAVVVFLSGGVFAGTAATAAQNPPNKGCATVEGVFARGSGQPLRRDEAERFRTQLEKRVKAPLTQSFYELGSESHGGASYPAVTITDLGVGQVNIAGAAVSAGESFTYGRSVDEGALELVTYMGARAAECPDMLFILGGYSQGAQVVGQAYADMPVALRERIVWNILVGDPKLSLPEGKGYNPAACRGEDLSEWRRAVPECTTDAGRLLARDPYLPAGFEDKTGLYCQLNDFVCGSTVIPWPNPGHGKYPLEGGDIDNGMLEAVEHLGMTLGDRSNLDITWTGYGKGTTGLDVVFVIDTTGSMSSQIESARAYARTMSETITGLRGRVALVEYRDAGDDFVSVIRTPLTTDLAAFTSALDALTVDGGGDTPEALLSALMTAFNGLEWRDGATKASVVLTDADFHDPDVAGGWTSADVFLRSLEIDPVNVYPVVPSYLADYYAPLAEGTSGQVIVDDGDTAGALTDALTAIQNRPTVLLPLVSYAGQPGETFTFDASASYAESGAIQEVSFDFDGDGIFEQVGTDLTASHVYDAPFDGTMQVRVTDTEGGVASASAFVTIADGPIARETVPQAPLDLTGAATDPVDGTSSVALRWSPGDQLADRWRISVNDVPLGTSDLNTSEGFTVTDVDRSAPVIIGVAAVTSTGVVGELATVTINAAAAVPVPPVTTPGDESPEPEPSSGAGQPAPTAPTASNPTPGATPAASVIRPRADGDDDLAWTGSAAAPWLYAGSGLILAGLIVLIVRRRRRSA
ncbi:cutinase family protein [Frigoribacterium sp. SL97]|uniref:cutinase family protein n=1 Tax=Frigoribacterium sp. SL97 TaxID=2994664 RepID=UPI00227078E5|nr:cutinase family protein [Frigoribacterium sp. SL97]WAC50271.1 cutinase family protein [Frigoribacterium sp. SL97]